MKPTNHTKQYTIEPTKQNEPSDLTRKQINYINKSTKKRPRLHTQKLTTNQTSEQISLCTPDTNAEIQENPPKPNYDRKKNKPTATNISSKGKKNQIHKQPLTDRRPYTKYSKRNHPQKKTATTTTKNTSRR